MSYNPLIMNSGGPGLTGINTIIGNSFFGGSANTTTPMVSTTVPTGTEFIHLRGLISFGGGIRAGTQGGWARGDGFIDVANAQFEGAGSSAVWMPAASWELEEHSTDSVATSSLPGYLLNATYFSMEVNTFGGVGGSLVFNFKTGDLGGGTPPITAGNFAVAIVTFLKKV